RRSRSSTRGSPVCFAMARIPHGPRFRLGLKNSVTCFDRHFTVWMNQDQEENAFPMRFLEKVLRIPKAILDQNAGRECSEKDTATFLGVKYNRGPYALELSLAIKFGLLERPSHGRIAVSDLAKKILHPQNEQEELIGLREAVLKAPD